MILFQITDLQHSVTSPMSFRLEYKRGSNTGPAMFQRQVRMQVDLNHLSTSDMGPEALYAITFTLLSGNYNNVNVNNVTCDWIYILSGNIRRFRRICEHTQSVVSVVRRPPPSSPRAARRATSKSSRSSSNADLSESSSCNSDIVEQQRLSERLGAAAAVTKRQTSQAENMGATNGRNSQVMQRNKWLSLFCECLDSSVKT